MNSHLNQDIEIHTGVQVPACLRIFKHKLLSDIASVSPDKDAFFFQMSILKTSEALSGLSAVSTETEHGILI